MADAAKSRNHSALKQPLALEAHLHRKQAPPLGCIRRTGGKKKRQNGKRPRTLQRGRQNASGGPAGKRKADRACHRAGKCAKGDNPRHRHRCARSMAKQREVPREQYERPRDRAGERRRHGRETLVVTHGLEGAGAHEQRRHGHGTGR